MECCWNFEEAQRLVLGKPRNSGTAYTYWKPTSMLYRKPAGGGATYTNEHNYNGLGFLFVFGVYTGLQVNG